MSFGNTTILPFMVGENQLRTSNHAQQEYHVSIKAAQHSILYEHQDDMHWTLGTTASRAARFASSISQSMALDFSCSQAESMQGPAQ